MRPLHCLTAALALSAAVAWGAADCTIPERHRPQKIMGRDFWRALYRYGDHALSSSWASNARAVRYDNPAINQLEAFTDVIHVYFGRRMAPADKPAWRSFRDNFRDEEPDKEIVTANPFPDKPLIVQTTGKRGYSSWGGEPELDYAEYKAWKAAHPNLLYDGSCEEWYNDLMMSYEPGRIEKKISDPVRLREIKAFLGEKPKDRYAGVAKMRQYYEMRKKLYYGGDLRIFDAHIYSLHLAADFGAKYLAIETTNTSGGKTDNTEYRWNTAAMFTRGAARQFGRPWVWYVAAYMNGWTADGRWVNNAVTVYPESEKAPMSYSLGVTGNFGPEFGVSASLLRRAYFFSFLSGANVTELEEWSAQLQMWDRKEKKTALSPRAKDYIAFADFAKAHPGRGVPYTPVAICVPIAQGYSSFGGHSWATPSYGYTAGDRALDAIFFTLVPGFPRAEAMKRGVECNLHNTPYAQMYDVISPDAKSQSPEELLAVMKSYRALVVAGDYPDRAFEATLAKYAAEGGRVIRIGDHEVPRFGSDAINDLRGGKFAFPQVAAVFDDLQRDYFPFKVAGDCLYGANRTADGWWLWVFNNKGVTKFADAPEKIDHGCDVRVTVTADGGVGAVRELVCGRTVAATDSGFSSTVPAGDLAVFEIR